MDGVQQESSEPPAMADDSPAAGPGVIAPTSRSELSDISTDTTITTATSGTSGTNDTTSGVVSAEGTTDRTATTAAAQATSHVQEISQQNIKNRLNEVITEIEREVEQELAGDEPEEAGGEQRVAPPEGAQEIASPPIATPPTSPEPAHQSAAAAEGQGESNDQWQPDPTAVSQSVASGVVSEQNSSLSTDVTSNRTHFEDMQPEPHVPNVAASSVTPTRTSMVSAQAQTEPIAYQARDGRFPSPYTSTNTSSLPRGWPGGGGTAFAISGHPTAPATAHEAPERQRTPPMSAHDQWKAREAAASPYATLPRMNNAQPRGWGAGTGAPNRGDHPKRVHFADAPQVETFENDAEVTTRAPEVTMRPRPEAGRTQRPVSAPAAAQLFTIPNMAARPYGRTSPLVVAPVKRESPPPPAPGGGHVQVDACVREESEMSSQLPEPEPVPEPPAPPAPPVQQTHVPPSKVFTPAHDEPVIPHKKKTMFVDSAFFSPKVHPTWEQQVEMAKKISSSLSDASNKQSKGQSMYERRKKRSVKWVHGGSQSENEDGAESPHVPKDKPLLQLLMNPHGHVYDMNALKKQGWIIDNKGGLSPEICSDLIKDLNSPTGKGAQIFAKRKKRAEKWVVDEEHRETRKTDESQVDAPSQPKPAVPPPQPAQPAPQPAQPAPKPSQPAPAFQQPPVQLAPVPLQSLYQPPPAPLFPSGGVYAPRTAHSWSAVQEQSETKKFKSTSSKAFNEITQGHAVTNTSQSSARESHNVSSVSSQSMVSESYQQSRESSQQSRLTQAMQHEESESHSSSTQILETLSSSGMSRQELELRAAEKVFEETARQMETTSSEQGRHSLGSIDIPGDVNLTSSDPTDLEHPYDPMEIDPDAGPQLALLKPIDKPFDWTGGVTEVAKPTASPVTKPVAEPVVPLPALKPIAKPADWTGPQESTRSSDYGVADEEPKPLVTLKHVSLPEEEKVFDNEPEPEPKPLVTLRHVEKPVEHSAIDLVEEEPKPLVTLKSVPKPAMEAPPLSLDDQPAAFGARLTPSRPAGGQRQSQLTSEVSEEVSGVWGRVSAIRDTFDSGSRPAVPMEKPRAPTMAVPNAFHQTSFSGVEPKLAATAPRLGKSREAVSMPAARQQQEDQLMAWGDADEQTMTSPAQYGSGHTRDLTSDIGQSAGITESYNQSYQTSESSYQSHTACASSEFGRSATDGSSGGWSQQQPITTPLAGGQPMSAPDPVDDVMFQCEVALVETSVNQEALQAYLGGSAGLGWQGGATEEARPLSAPPVPEVTMRRPPAAPAPAEPSIDHITNSQGKLAAPVASWAERQRNRQSWTNYNTAPRGWGNQDHFYRPVTFTQPLMTQ
ncbi:uncharacterized protein LOC122371244 isoform X2 [Amphibalanus amphitrite]|uniref:uncharacterized protein LOC122371244 isoform X2 n=1 Tax=Amphibalanus amphitrite TaxID=1232801 RepID=UPI001C9078FE|nr:uncharacterized protein LOC122371244 isoform X2 [Amphibalanus amphitrite]